MDDMKSMRAFIRAVLEESGLSEIDEAEDGEGALSLLGKTRYGLIISDWNMPRMDGITLLRTVRSNETLKTLPVIMLTTEATREQILETKSLGVSGYVRKPFKPEDLAAAVRRVIAPAK
ncbi:MAG: response regulator [Nevskia sp.]|nr:response regulator [Nevskia sp.]